MVEMNMEKSVVVRKGGDKSFDGKDLKIFCGLLNSLGGSSPKRQIFSEVARLRNNPVQSYFGSNLVKSSRKINEN
jgi:hypothetical protein